MIQLLLELGKNPILKNKTTRPRPSEIPSGTLGWLSFMLCSWPVFVLRVNDGQRFMPSLEFPSLHDVSARLATSPQPRMGSGSQGMGNLSQTGNEWYFSYPRIKGVFISLCCTPPDPLLVHCSLSRWQGSSPGSLDPGSPSHYSSQPALGWSLQDPPSGGLPANCLTFQHSTEPEKQDQKEVSKMPQVTWEHLGLEQAGAV